MHIPPQRVAFLPDDKPAAEVFTDDVVVIWGVDVNKLRAEEANSAERSPYGTIIAYEKHAGGERMAYTTMGSMLLRDEDFRKAQFAGGHKP